MLFELDAGVFFGLICLNGCESEFDLDLVRWVWSWLEITAQIDFFLCQQDYRQDFFRQNSHIEFPHLD